MQTFISVAMIIFVCIFFIGVLFSVVQKIISIVKLKKLKKEIENMPSKEGIIESSNVDNGIE